MYFKIKYFNVFHFIIIFSKNKSNMCEKKAVLRSLLLSVLVAATFCIYQAQTENEVGHHSQIKSQGPCENEYKEYCFNGGECFYLVNKNIVGRNCTWLYGRKRCETHMWWD